MAKEKIRISDIPLKWLNNDALENLMGDSDECNKKKKCTAGKMIELLKKEDHSGFVSALPGEIKNLVKIWNDIGKRYGLDLTDDRNTNTDRREAVIDCLKKNPNGVVVKTKDTDKIPVKQKKPFVSTAEEKNIMKKMKDMMDLREKKGQGIAKKQSLQIAELEKQYTFVAESLKATKEMMTLIMKKEFREEIEGIKSTIQRMEEKRKESDDKLVQRILGAVSYSQKLQREAEQETAAPQLTEEETKEQLHALASSKNEKVKGIANDLIGQLSGQQPSPPQKTKVFSEQLEEEIKKLDSSPVSTGSAHIDIKKSQFSEAPNNNIDLPATTINDQIKSVELELEKVRRQEGLAQQIKETELELEKVRRQISLAEQIKEKKEPPFNP